jgi:hypothetical protein
LTGRKEEGLWSLKRNEILVWLLLFAKHVGDKPPDETVTVLPYRQIKPIWEEYVDDISSSNGLFGTPAKYSPLL